MPTSEESLYDYELRQKILSDLKKLKGRVNYPEFLANAITRSA